MGNFVVKEHLKQLESKVNNLYVAAHKLPYDNYHHIDNIRYNVSLLFKDCNKLIKLDNNIQHHLNKKKNSGRKRQHSILFNRITLSIERLEKEITWKLLGY